MYVVVIYIKSHVNGLFTAYLNSDANARWYIPFILTNFVCDKYAVCLKPI